ncbi:MAG: glycosyltransferase [Pseudomonadota bacterium]
MAKVSIVIPTKNGATTLPAVLDAIDSQRTDWDYEVVVVDSGSVDGTIRLVENRVQHLIQIPPEKFNHGLTRNLGIEQAQGRAVVMLVQDSVPSDTRWLHKLVSPLFEKQELAGTFGRQIPRPEASRICRRMLFRWVASRMESYVRTQVTEEVMQEMTPVERLTTCAFDNVCSCVSREVWEKHPFPSAPFAEDLEWAKTVLQAGYSIAYVPDAAVVHSHDRSLSYELARTYIAHKRLYDIFGLHTIPTAKHLCRSVLVTALDHARCLIEEPGPAPDLREILRTMGLAVVWPLGQYLGGLAETKWAGFLPVQEL